MALILSGSRSALVAGGRRSSKRRCRRSLLRGVGFDLLIRALTICRRGDANGSRCRRRGLVLIMPLFSAL